MRVPNYLSGDLAIDPASKPKIRLLCIDSAVKHTAEASVNGFILQDAETPDLFNRSPQAVLLKRNMKINTFMRTLKGMNGDHASKEKSAAQGLGEKKHEYALRDLGDDALLSMSFGDLVKYLGTWNLKKIVEVGGQEE